MLAATWYLDLIFKIIAEHNASIDTNKQKIIQFKDVQEELRSFLIAYEKFYRLYDAMKFGSIMRLISLVVKYLSFTKTSLDPYEAKAVIYGAAIISEKMHCLEEKIDVVYLDDHYKKWKKPSDLSLANKKNIHNLARKFIFFERYIHSESYLAELELTTHLDISKTVQLA